MLGSINAAEQSSQPTRVYIRTCFGSKDSTRSAHASSVGSTLSATQVNLRHTASTESGIYLEAQSEALGF